MSGGFAFGSGGSSLPTGRIASSGNMNGGAFRSLMPGVPSPFQPVPNKQLPSVLPPVQTPNVFHPTVMQAPSASMMPPAMNMPLVYGQPGFGETQLAPGLDASKLQQAPRTDYVFPGQRTTPTRLLNQPGPVAPTELPISRSVPARIPLRFPSTTVYGYR